MSDKPKCLRVNLRDFPWVPTLRPGDRVLCVKENKLARVTRIWRADTVQTTAFGLTMPAEESMGEICLDLTTPEQEAARDWQRVQIWTMTADGRGFDRHQLIRPTLAWTLYPMLLEGVFGYSQSAAFMLAEDTQDTPYLSELRPMRACRDFMAALRGTSDMAYAWSLFTSFLRMAQSTDLSSPEPPQTVDSGTIGTDLNAVVRQQLRQPRAIRVFGDNDTP